MTQPPNLNYRDVSPSEMNGLVLKYKIEERIASCKQDRFPQQQDIYHEQFCCKKDLVLFTDPQNGEEIAVAIEQIHADQNKGITRTFHQIRVDNDVYRLRLP